MEAHYYNVDLKWMSDRKGLIFSPELESKIEVATPPQFAKGIEGLWSPEHLLTAAVNSCFMTTFLAIAENSGLEFTNFECNAKGKLEQVEGKLLMTEVHIGAILKIKDAANEEKAMKILKKAEAACLISNSIKSKVILGIQINY